MFIPTQQERYSKAAKITLLLCVMIPSAVVAWLAGIRQAFVLMFSFMLPIAMPLDWLGFNHTAALIIAAVIEGTGYIALVRAKKLTPKTKLTIAITWGMAFALLLKLFHLYAVWRQVTGLS